MTIFSKNYQSHWMDGIQSEDFKRRLLWHGFFIPLYANPRAGLATHLLGTTEGLFVAIIGLSYPQLKLPDWVARVNFWMLLVSAYAGIFGELLGAIFGLTRIFLITAIALPETMPWLETIVEVAIKGISTFIILSCFIVLYELRKDSSKNKS